MCKAITGQVVEGVDILTSTTRRDTDRDNWDISAAVLPKNRLWRRNPVDCST